MQILMGPLQTALSLFSLIEKGLIFNKDVGKCSRRRKNKNFHVLQILCQFLWVHCKFFLAPYLKSFRLVQRTSLPILKAVS